MRKITNIRVPQPDKNEDENNKDKNKGSMWDMSKKSRTSHFNVTQSSVPSSNNPNKRFLLLEFFNKKIREDMSNEWNKLLGFRIDEYSKLIRKRGTEGAANFVILSSRAAEMYRDVIIGEQDNEQDNEQNENL